MISDTVAPGGVLSKSPLMPSIGFSAISIFGDLPASTVIGWFWLMKPGGASIETWCGPGEMPRIRDGSLSVRDSPSRRHVVMPPGTT